MNKKKMINTQQVRCILTNVGIAQRAAEGDEPSRTISGYAVRFNEWSKPFWDEWIESIDSHAFDACDMSDVVMCVDHSTSVSDVLARSQGDSGTLAVSVDAIGVHFSFDTPKTTTGNDLLELVRRGDVSECSFKFIAAEDRWVWRSPHNGLEYDQRIITRINKLYDLSVVVSPQYNNTSAVAERAAVADLRAAQATPRRGISIAKESDFLRTEYEHFNK
ncbi:MAG: HK97 family phage prohead protease [Alistipes sp.]